MADEQEPIVEAPEAGAEAPTEPTVEEPERIEPEAPEAEAEGEEEQQPAEDADWEDFEWDGKALKVPKSLRDGVMMHADYTKKTQEVAAQRRELENTAKRVQEQARLYSEDLEKRAEYVSVRKQLEQYGQVDWQQYADSDPVAAQKHYIAFQQLQGQARQLEGEIQQRQSQRAAEAQRSVEEATAKRLAETQEFARKSIKGWTPETDKQVIDFAIAQGVELDDLRAAMNPTIYKILHLASLGHKVLEKPATQPPATKAQPLQTVSARGNAPARKSLADMSMDEYAAYRQKQMAKG